MEVNRMELIQNNMKETISMSQNILMNYVDDETPVGIHIHGKSVNARNSVVIREFSLESNELYIEGDQFILDINEDIVDIRYIDDEESIYILFEDREIYIDKI